MPPLPEEWDVSLISAADTGKGLCASWLLPGDSPNSYGLCVNLRGGCPYRYFYAFGVVFLRKTAMQIFVSSELSPRIFIYGIERTKRRN